jgi:hypothetical protein
VGNCAEGATARREIAAKVLIMVHPNRIFEDKKVQDICIVAVLDERCSKARREILQFSVICRFVASHRTDLYQPYTNIFFLVLELTQGINYMGAVKASPDCRAHLGVDSISPRINLVEYEFYSGKYSVKCIFGGEPCGDRLRSGSN